MKPTVSVLIPVYNAEATLKAAVWSVLNQSYENFELLIFLDGCTDGSEALIKSFQDRRIRVIKSDDNVGIVNARNRLVQEACGDFIAWLDADDIALPGRLAYQYDFMEVHPELMVLGSWVELRNSRSIKSVKWPVTNDYLQAWVFFRNPFVQSSLMLRNKKGIISYEKEFEYLEDYRLLSLLAHKGEIAIYPEYLCSYFEEEEQSRIAKYLRYDFVSKLENIMRENFQKLGLNPGKNELSLIREFLRNNRKLKKEEAGTVYKFFKSAMKSNTLLGLCSKQAFNGVCMFQLLRLMRLNINFAPKICFMILKNPIITLGAIKARVKYLD